MLLLFILLQTSWNFTTFVTENKMVQKSCSLQILWEETVCIIILKYTMRKRQYLSHNFQFQYIFATNMTKNYICLITGISKNAVVLAIDVL